MVKTKILYPYIFFLLIYMSIYPLLTVSFNQHVFSPYFTPLNNSLDTDEDGLPDSVEIQIGTHPYLYDSDLDGLADGDEVQYYHSNPLAKDTDLDGILDAAEINLHLNVKKKDPASIRNYRVSEKSYIINLYGDGNFSIFLQTHFPYNNNIIAVYSPFAFEYATIEASTPTPSLNCIYIWTEKGWMSVPNQIRSANKITAPLTQYGFYVLAPTNKPPNAITTTISRQSGFLPEINGYSFANSTGKYLIEKKGLCFGIVTTAKLQFENHLPYEKRLSLIPYKVPNIQPVFDAEFDVYQAAIRYWFWKQFNVLWFMNNFQFSKGNTVEIEKMKSLIDNKQTFIIGVNKVIHEMPESHAVLAYAYKMDLLTRQTSFYIYDPNFPMSYVSNSLREKFRKSIIFELTPYYTKNKSFYTFKYHPFSNNNFFTMNSMSYKWFSTEQLGNFYFSTTPLS